MRKHVPAQPQTSLSMISHFHAVLNKFSFLRDC